MAPEESQMNIERKVDRCLVYLQQLQAEVAALRNWNDRLDALKAELDAVSVVVANIDKGVALLVANSKKVVGIEVTPANPVVRP